MRSGLAAPDRWGQVPGWRCVTLRRAPAPGPAAGSCWCQRTAGEPETPRPPPWGLRRCPCVGSLSRAGPRAPPNATAPTHRACPVRGVLDPGGAETCPSVQPSSPPPAPRAAGTEEQMAAGDKEGSGPRRAPTRTCPHEQDAACGACWPWGPAGDRTGWHHVTSAMLGGRPDQHRVEGSREQARPWQEGQPRTLEGVRTRSAARPKCPGRGRTWRPGVSSDRKQPAVARARATVGGVLGVTKTCWNRGEACAVWAHVEATERHTLRERVTCVRSSWQSCRSEGRQHRVCRAPSLPRPGLGRSPGTLQAARGAAQTHPELLSPPAAVSWPGPPRG